MSERVHPIVEPISTYFNGVGVELYFIRSGRKIIIDTGTRQSPQRDILPRLRAFDLTLSDISIILNTHGHFDHTSGNRTVKEVSGAEIWIHQNDAVFLWDHSNCFGRYLAPVVKAIESSVTEEEQAFLEMMGPEVTPDQQLKDGDIVDGGEGVELKVVHLPGHTLGSVGFYWEKEGILFSGDSVVGLHIEGGKLPVIFDLEAYRRSLQRLQEMPIRFLLCAHYYRGVRLPARPVRQEEDLAEFLKDSREFAQRLDDAMTKAIPYLFEKSWMQVADLVISYLPREMGFLPMSKVQRPLYSAQTIFFGIQQLVHQDKSDGFKGGGNAD
jgi:glyoxylase-like metal-dependent hydrolase (beta-lactamase superfamily II)